MINLQYKTTSANFIILLILLVISFSDCIINQQEDCKRKIGLAEASFESCIDTMIASQIIISKTAKIESNQDTYGDMLFRLGLAKYLNALQQEKNCNKKSEYLPAIRS